MTGEEDPPSPTATPWRVPLVGVGRGRGHQGKGGGIEDGRAALQRHAVDTTTARGTRVAAWTPSSSSSRSSLMKEG